MRWYDYEGSNTLQLNIDYFNCVGIRDVYDFEDVPTGGQIMYDECAAWPFHLLIPEKDDPLTCPPTSPEG